MISVRVSHFTAKIITAVTLSLMLAGLAPAYGQMMRMDALAMAKPGVAAEPFGRATSYAPAGPLWIKWRGIDTGLAQDEATIEHCRADEMSCAPAAARLVALIDEARTLTGRQRLAVVNRAVNLSIAYTDDEWQFGSPDVWSNPVATFTSGRGDCEDYAIAKMFTLRAAGIPAEDLRLVVARLRDGNHHAVLAARDDGKWLMLDNRSMTLVEDRYSLDLTPLYALETHGVRQFGEQETVVAANTTPAPQLPVWPASAPAPIYPYEPIWLAM